MSLLSLKRMDRAMALLLVNLNLFLKSCCFSSTSLNVIVDGFGGCFDPGFGFCWGDEDVVGVCFLGCLLSVGFCFLLPFGVGFVDPFIWTISLDELFRVVRGVEAIIAAAAAEAAAAAAAAAEDALVVFGVVPLELPSGLGWVCC